MHQKQNKKIVIFFNEPHQKLSFYDKIGYVVLDYCDVEQNIIQEYCKAQGLDCNFWYKLELVQLNLKDFPILTLPKNTEQVYKIHPCT